MGEIREDYTNLLNSLTDMAFFTDLSDNFLAVNNIVVKNLNYSKEELLFMTHHDILSPDSRGILSQTHQDLQKGKEITLNAVYESKLGKKINVKVSASHINFINDELLLFLAHDLRETSLMDVKDKLESLLEDFQRIAKTSEEISSLSKEENELADTIEKALRRYQLNIIKNNLIVVKEIQAPLKGTYDEDTIIQVIWALFQQIIQYSKGRIWINGNKENNKLMITFKYNGPPFPQQEIPNSSRISKIIDAHEGILQIEEASSEETLITITLPQS